MSLLAPDQLQRAVRDLGVPSTGGRRLLAARAAWQRLRKARPRTQRYGQAATKLSERTKFYHQAINLAVCFGT